MSSNTPNGKRVIVKRTSKDLEAGAEREGYLQKRSRKGKWQRRWFTLTSSGTLNYAKDLASASVDGASTALDLAGVTDVTREVGSTDIALLFGGTDGSGSASAAAAAAAAAAAKSPALADGSAADRYDLRADSAAEAEAWCERLRSLCELVDPEPEGGPVSFLGGGTLMGTLHKSPQHKRKPATPAKQSAAAAAATLPSVIDDGSSEDDYVDDDGEEEGGGAGGGGMLPTAAELAADAAKGAEQQAEVQQQQQQAASSGRSIPPPALLTADAPQASDASRDGSAGDDGGGGGGGGGGGSRAQDYGHDQHMTKLSSQLRDETKLRERAQTEAGELRRRLAALQADSRREVQAAADASDAKAAVAAAAAAAKLDRVQEELSRARVEAARAVARARAGAAAATPGAVGDDIGGGGGGGGSSFASGTGLRQRQAAARRTSFAQQQSSQASFPTARRTSFAQQAPPSTPATFGSSSCDDGGGGGSPAGGSSSSSSSSSSSAGAVGRRLSSAAGNALLDFAAKIVPSPSPGPAGSNRTMVRRNSRYFPKTGDDSADQGALRRQISQATATASDGNAEGPKIGASSLSSSAAAAAEVAGEGEATKYERVMYVLDEAFATNPYASSILLLAITAALVFVGGLSHWFALGCDGSPLASMWSAWRFVTDGGDYDEGVAPRAVGVVLVLSGMLFFALLVGLIGETIESKLDSLKHGKNKVIENGHTLVLGWSDKFLPLAREIAKANESEGGGVIVVLAEQDKEWMDETVLEELGAEEMMGTTVVCRSGNPVMVSDLRKVRLCLPLPPWSTLFAPLTRSAASAAAAAAAAAAARRSPLAAHPASATTRTPQVSATAARAIVVLAKYDIAPDESDARAVRAVLALRAGLPWLSGHTVVEMRDVDNLPILELLAGGSQEQATHSIQAIVPHDVIGRLMIQCARQRHLAEVYDHLCGFDGCEFYFQTWPDLTARRWGEVLYSFADACPIGVRHGAVDGSKILLNPPDDYRMRAGDELLVVAEDDDTYSPDLGSGAKAPKVGAAPAFEARKATNDNVLLCGWRRDLLDMLMELDKYVQPGCVVTILASVPLSQRTALLETGKATRLELQNIQLTHEHGSTILRRDLEKVRSLPLLPLLCSLSLSLSLSFSLFLSLSPSPFLPPPHN
jgi:hypothetical protein